jgi:quinoprotein glucose dehydrogenase
MPCPLSLVDNDDIPYRPQALGSPDSRFRDPNLYPCQTPPRGSLTAIDLDHGVFRWRSTLGVIDALVAKGIPPTGLPNIGGSIVTAGGLIFIAATDDSPFRASTRTPGRSYGSHEPGSKSLATGDVI